MSVHKADCVFVCSADGHKQTLLTVALAYADYISAFFSKKLVAVWLRLSTYGTHAHKHIN